VSAGPPVAGLPMYDLPGTAEWQDAWWAGLARHLRAAGLREVPDALTRPPRTEDLWADPRLLFGQACGYPLVQGLGQRLKVVATPCYDAPGCDGPRYASRIVVPADSPATTLAEVLGGVCAINGHGSQSGCQALRGAVAEVTDRRRPFREVLVTGSHLASLRAVAEGRADVCAVDCVTHALCARHAPDLLAGTRCLGTTPTAPGLPYVTAGAHDEDVLARLRDGLIAALDDPELAEVRAALLIAGAVPTTLADYRCIAEQAAALARQGPLLA